MAVPDLSERIFTEVDRRGVLLLHDRQLPSVTALVVGEPVAGSWWSHPQAHAIFAAVTALEDRVANVSSSPGRSRSWPRACGHTSSPSGRPASPGS
jgi:hypothetical protein